MRRQRPEPWIGTDGGQMVGHGAKFSHKMEQAIAALLTCRSVEAAARAAGIGVNTLLRWIKAPEFDAAYREARRLAFLKSIARLQDAEGAAVTTVLKIMLDVNVPPGTRLRAAEVVLAFGIKAVEIEEAVARVTELERAAGSIHKSHAGSAIVPWPTKKALPSPAADSGTDQGS
jgi:hypothetical protein